MVPHLVLRHETKFGEILGNGWYMPKPSLNIIGACWVKSVKSAYKLLEEDRVALDTLHDYISLLNCDPLVAC